MIKPEDQKLIMGMIREEIKAFAKNADSVLMEELGECKQALDGANKNIFKLQAQLTALKLILFEKGIVGRDALYDKEMTAFEDLVKSAQRERALSQEKQVVGKEG